MKKITLLLFAITILISAQDMRQNSFRSLFSDQKANRLGDAITILVMEASEASNNAQTSAGRNSEIGFGASGSMDGNSVVPNVDLNIGSNNEFNGSGATKSAGMVKTRITATIDSVLQNGNLFIRGSRLISINGEEQKIFLTGVVRVADIASDNTVKSYNISDAKIILEGNGMIDRMQSPGWLTKLFHWLF
ncbi:MAG: flagellar basal body L-ring protein FlgH [Melioribacteraceae bacterium]|jgi:flagellar L-ring protein precursor FlgH|nr:flagellar basal body L-ring protein FlgH [Melioribacteraceae bacterium]RJP63132.1 MAG: flagellar basal body L-ring protein FlgH [Ignavibacteriales bacterium]WKZ70148.1 MAG: flagellar basal body L-ring protein FlgH [Melioribacteraceae bacterium]